MGARGRWRICCASLWLGAPSLQAAFLFRLLLLRLRAAARLPHRAGRPPAPTAARPPAPRADNINEGKGAGPRPRSGPSLNVTDSASWPINSSYRRPAGRAAPWVAAARGAGPAALANERAAVSGVCRCRGAAGCARGAAPGRSGWAADGAPSPGGSRRCPARLEAAAWIVLRARGRPCLPPPGFPVVSPCCSRRSTEREGSRPGSGLCPKPSSRRRVPELPPRGARPWPGWARTWVDATERETSAEAAGWFPERALPQQPSSSGLTSLGIPSLCCVRVFRPAFLVDPKYEEQVNGNIDIMWGGKGAAASPLPSLGVTWSACNPLTMGQFK